MEKIKSISEAFSMQPRHLEITEMSYYEKCKNEAAKKEFIKVIKLEDKGQYPDKELYYVGYNFEGDKLFQYIANTVNVHYEAV